MIYEVLLDEAVDQGLVVAEFELHSRANGLINGNLIGIRKSMDSAEKGCVLAEELGHHYTSTGNILDQYDLNNRRQELRARQWAHMRIIPFKRFLDAYRARVSGRYEIACFLGVTEKFLQEAVDRYRDKYGLYIKLDDQHTLCLEPLGVIELFSHT